MRPRTPAGGKLVTDRGLVNVRLLELAEVESTIEAGSLDYVVATDVLEHVPDLGSCIATFARLLRPAGLLVMSGPTETALYRLGRLLAGFAGKEHYHHTDVFRSAGRSSVPAASSCSRRGPCPCRTRSRRF